VRRERDGLQCRGMQAVTSGRLLCGCKDRGTRWQGMTGPDGYRASGSALALVCLSRERGESLAPRGGEDSGGCR
jgi:hypothetical protein